MQHNSSSDSDSEGKGGTRMTWRKLCRSSAAVDLPDLKRYNTRQTWIAARSISLGHTRKMEGRGAKLRNIRLRSLLALPHAMLNDLNERRPATAILASPARAITGQ
ncbi:hypothetical protein COCMIDRAFT_31318 [Bipolaris oryzae ATCC 44560]|uniref:Uncharacterized protein n=1 Tax=Bipolaris oryzae ATCC 44560 TaxID=930090 RepID=W6YPR4_COCMI|nr:uncharacterized protein COCMIDRAFT_31318 [Bipolaris oryzae ATCC 44560]EUC39508.1 hypothetical protein COCMIDRAFT_31318 [Bipolaris oryzae ATCC 44560]